MVKAYYERAAGGWGLVEVEATYVRRDGCGFSRMLGFYNPYQITGMNELANAIHAGGAKASIQLMHGGRQRDPLFLADIPPVSASDVGWAGFTPHPLTTEECEELVNVFAQRAEWAKRAGFDTVLLHGAHGFLIGQFVSPYTNKRTDKYGDRYRFPSEIIQAVKSACGEDFPVRIRISGDEFLGEEGLTIEEVTRNYVPALEEAGVDHIDVSCGVFETGDRIIMPLYTRRAPIVDLAEAVKEATERATVGTVGRINDAALTKSIIEDGLADAVMLGRQALADPDFPKKMEEGRWEDIRKCTACDLGCTYRHISQFTIDCSVNPRLGHEMEDLYREPEDKMTPARVRKKVWVIGGGVAGMEAARVAQLREHNVFLFEKEAALGGTVALAADMPRLYTNELGNIATWEQTQLDKLGVAVKLGTEITAEMVEEGQPDAVVVAAGSKETMPAVPGADGPNVITLLTYLRDKPDVGDDVVVLGGQEGAEVSVSLAGEGKNVMLVEAGDTIADTPYFIVGGRRSQLHAFMVQRMDEGTLTVYTEAELKEIKPDEVVFASKEPTRTWVQAGSYAVAAAEEEVEAAEATERAVAADTVIVALGREPNRDLAGALEGKVPELYEVGEAVEVKNIRHSIQSGARVGRLI
jgi:2,4-dienoyl-CoA reductase-like NADH-dependent reductase (Old Yellow Enzyme family)/NADPH-dependent glutamate synthase beta subunit-like oxidoreductase